MPTGRPTVMQPDVRDELCARIASGRGISEVCSDKDMPDKTTVYRLMAKDEAFATRIARAREAQQDAEAENIVQLADKATIKNWPVVKLRIDARKWRAAKLAPKKYGDKIETTLQGPDGGAIKTEVDLASGLAFTLKKGLRVS